MAESIEVSVEPDESPSETTDLEQTTLAAGEASAHAEHAVELAENATESAENAEGMAIAAIETSYNVADDMALTRAELEGLRASQAELIENVNNIAQLVAGIAEIQLASVSPSSDTTKPPRDEAPQSRHWLEKKLF